MSNKQLQHIRTRSVEYSQFRLFRTLSLFTFLLFGCIMVVSLYFLYTRTYKAIGQVQQIVSLGPITQTIILDERGYATVESDIKTREESRLAELSRDPFNTIPKPILNVPTSN